MLSAHDDFVYINELKRVQLGAKNDRVGQYLI